MKEKPVFSTDKSVTVKSKNDDKQASYQKSNGPAKVRLEKKGRAGKTVTVLYDLPFEEAEAKAFMKKLQNQLACGATLKNSTIELRGDLKDKLRDIFEKQGLPLKG